MPIFVDHDERREQILAAAAQVLGDVGLSKFTLRRVGERLGGSVTLVTHYYASREALLEAMLEKTLRDAETVREELLRIADPHERLRAVLVYFLPLDEDSVTIERSRVALSSHRNVEPAVRDFLTRLEPAMRAVVRAGIDGFVDPSRLDATVDLIRIWTSGMVLTAIEHPEIWTSERQLAALQHLTQLIDLPSGDRSPEGERART